MKIRPALLAPLCAVALGAAFFAGHAVGSKAAMQDEAQAGPAQRPASRERSAARSAGSKPFASGEANAWVSQLDQMKDLRGAHLKMYVAKQCSSLDAAAAEELLSHCDRYQGLLEACFPSEQPPSRDLVNALNLYALARLSELDPEKALAVLSASSSMKEDPELVLTALTPIAAIHPEQAVAFLGEVGDRSAEVVSSLRLVPAIYQNPQLEIKLVEFCKKDGRALGELLSAVSDKDPELAQKTLSDLALQEDGFYPSEVWSEAAGWLFNGFSSQEFQAWAVHLSGQDASKLQAFAVRTLLHSYLTGSAADLFTSVSAGIPAEQREDLAETIGLTLGERSQFNEAEKWLSGLAGPDKELALQGLFENRCQNSRGPGAFPPADQRADPAYWLNLMAPSGEKDGLLSRYAVSLQEQDQAGAGALVEKISDPAIKKKTERELELETELSRLRKSE